jgi:hypothetical protein
MAASKPKPAPELTTPLVGLPGGADMPKPPPVSEMLEKMLPLGRTPEGEFIKGRVVVGGAFTDVALQQMSIAVTMTVMAELERRGVIRPEAPPAPPSEQETPPAEA